MLKIKSIRPLLFSAAFFLCLQNLNVAAAEEPVETIITKGHFFGEARYRYEFVDQENITNSAKASTVRTNIGFKTGEYNDFNALIEGQIVQNIGANSFNDTVNSKTAYPVVADPDVAEINQAWISWNGLTDIELKAGRQGINWDNQRFIGTVNWRQNDQTFDSGLFTYTGLDETTLQYGYIWNVNRIFGDDNPLGDLNTQSHIIRLNHKWSDWLDTTAYGYFLDFDRLASRSSQTYGIRATGQAPLNENWIFSYQAEAATQRDYKNNPANYDEEYYHLAPSLSGYGFLLTAGYETLKGDRANAFQTPLATLHKFNGWADAFLNTPATGLEDYYASASYKITNTQTPFDNVQLTAVYHDFSSKNDFGNEVDFSIGKTFTLPDAGQPFKNLNVQLKYADYNGDSGIADREKFWLQMGIKF